MTMIGILAGQVAKSLAIDHYTGYSAAHGAKSIRGAPWR